MTSIKGVADVRTRFDVYRDRAHRIVALVASPNGTTISEKELAEMIGISTGELTTTRHLLVAIGAVMLDTSHKPATWHVLKGGDELDQALDIEMERQMRGGYSPEARRKQVSLTKHHPPTRKTSEQVAVEEDRLGFPVGAVVGPEPESPMFGLKQIEKHEREPAALVNAAKQYVSAKAGGDTKIKRAVALINELNEIGVPIPPELRAAATVPTDERLEAIALVLPYITALERRVVALSDQLRDQPKISTLTQTVQKQRSQIERLVAERTQAALEERARR